MKALERARELLKRALQEHASPRQMALAVALGALVGTSPLLGLHLVVGAALATALRLNRALAVLGTNISFGPILPLVVIGEVRLGSWLLGKTLPPMTAENAVEIARSALGAWLVGFAAVGPAVASLVGLVVYALASWRDRKRAATTPQGERLGLQQGPGGSRRGRTPPSRDRSREGRAQRGRDREARGQGTGRGDLPHPPQPPLLYGEGELQRGQPAGIPHLSPLSSPSPYRRGGGGGEASPFPSPPPLRTGEGAGGHR